MAFELSFEVSGDVQIARKLQRFGDHVEDMSPAFEKMHESFLDIERRQFDTQGGSGPGGWQPIKPQTLRHKLAKGLDPRILHATLRLRRSLTNKTSQDHVTEIAPQEFFTGSSVPYVGVHQNPKPTNTRAIRRRPVDLTESQRRAWVRIAQAHLVGALNE